MKSSFGSLSQTAKKILVIFKNDLSVILPGELVWPQEEQLGDYVRTGRDSTEVVSYVNITSVRPEDGGLYECEASNDVGKATHSARVNVFGPPFVRSMSNLSVVAGETLRLQCPVGGHPIETIKWEKDGVRLPLNHRQKVFQNGTLLVRNVEKMSDSGPYKCSASNADGITAENTLHIKVIVKPLIEPFTFPKSLQTGQRFSVLCTITEGDPPIRIQWIKDSLQSFLASAHDGVRSVVVTPFSTTLVFESLAPEHRGNYTCVASNAAGTMSHTAPMNMLGLLGTADFRTSIKTFQGLRNQHVENSMTCVKGWGKKGGGEKRVGWGGFGLHYVIKQIVRTWNSQLSEA
ncbi:down syndrome cell adhesion molecule-like protein 1 homolog [Caerostris extrusa]|uniref:Down syndrome cell adhesion molecule-like protein 1 homolog n=1 Tax=Caerostris extrusa TaxID=172846 RepID=A0AAV4M439_CAEEX|nr:down syndrome cell adhesion molecule-like protein 1 homolog [Caerostris extrusa]